ncbi:protein of unknown function DUF81 (plasmid) [Gemmatirosa kalamazoonensis]|uniref:Probable membrane transporter protein n=1 Tax=Gemmatirosa kalamazoonensis TaxID=861299 RepID=W0RTA7_9BACT|nr:sulfite exporter TauE/SafE family protein [Gemmatirosa kalamazoonensis]AHG93560.1 protein of unknown function DUF81 [Gemmatirosa kalamazoonensis]
MIAIGGDALRLLPVMVAAALGGAVNAVAGGGTLLTFPSLVSLGISPIVANATSTVALWPGSVSSMYGYRDALRGAGGWAVAFAVPSLAGGALGAWLLLHTSPERFAHLAPWLVLGATSLFAMQGVLAARRGAVPELARPRLRHLAAQFAVGVYGGYFGAGIGILMLAVLGMIGLRDIHRMNGLKNWGGTCMNFVAAATFSFTRLVDWPVALAMAVGSIAGGYVASRGAQRVPQYLVRRAVLVVGFVSGAWLLVEQLRR